MTQPTGNHPSPRIGILSDTHGCLSPAVVDALENVDLIIHAGDVGGPDVLEDLKALAPLYPVRGNMDYGPWAGALRETDLIEVAGKHIYTLHDLSRLDLDPAAAGVDVVVSGHTHRPEAKHTNGILYLNPGSAAFPRFGAAPTIVVLDINRGKLYYRFIELTDA